MATKAETTGERVKRLRGKETQAELAKRVSQAFGQPVSQQSIDQLERGEVKAPRYLPDLALVLGTTVKYLRSGLGPERVNEVAGKLSLSYPETQVTEGQGQGVPHSHRGAGSGEANTRRVAVEASLLRELFEELGVLKHRITTLEAEVARREGGASPADPRKAGKGA